MWMDIKFGWIGGLIVLAILGTPIYLGIFIGWLIWG